MHLFIFLNLFFLKKSVPDLKNLSVVQMKPSDADWK